ncbi:MAG TPA: hypothetical protein HA252_07035 [Candidatus Diapherotrites archaeon]|uniref:Uncharacterized protein n=1 Tax=Candidatus Iainarchaeum sp. TaxID=3101447 RepID=A0A7J4JJU4_9ARCH|nr:hypothetical protein [Candidatus Diapherotrites archaeon]HIH17130.1 hypothetical protein [Candidatus Diapherotrites archaeon]
MKKAIHFGFLAVLALSSFAAFASAQETFCEGPVAGEYCMVYEVKENKCEKVVVPNCCRNDLCEVSEGYAESYGTCPADCPPTTLEFEVLNPAEGETYYLGEKGLLKITVSSSGFPVVGAELEVTGLPGPQFYLYNDGAHEDGSNFDNVYANRFPVEASMPPGKYPAQFVARFRKLEITRDFEFVVEPKISADVKVKDRYQLGDTIDLSGLALKKSEPAPIQVEAKVFYGSETKYSETVSADSSGAFSASYHLSTIDPVGKWRVQLQGKDSAGNELSYSKDVLVEAPRTKTELKLSPSIPNNTVLKRGEKKPVSVTVVDEEGNKVSGASVKVKVPDGRVLDLEDQGSGVYAVDLEIGYEFPAGSQQLEFSAAGALEGLPAEGMTRLLVVIESGKIVVEVLEPVNVHFRIGDALVAKLRLTYPDGSKVEEAEVKLVVSGAEAPLTALETGIFGGTYYLQEKDQGNRPVKFVVRDQHGNAVEKEVSIEVTGESLAFVLQKNWLMVLVVLVLVVGGGGYGFFQFSSKKSKEKMGMRRQQLKAMIEEINNKYYDEGTLPKSEFTRLTEKYGEELDKLEQQLEAAK